MQSFILSFRKIIIYVGLVFVIFAMWTTIAPHFSFRPDVDILKAKQQYIHIPFWRFSFYIHVFSAIFSLMAGLTQFSNTMLLQYPKLHKIIGRMYAWNILVINFPTAMVLSFTAQGYVMSKIGLATLDCLWFWFTYRAVILIKQKKVIQHKQYMMRSYAITLSAITVRLIKLTFDSGFHFNPAMVYTISSWAAMIINLTFVEWLIMQQTRKRTSNVQRHENIYAK